MKKNWLHAAGILWPFLAQNAAQRRTVTYEEAAKIIETNPLSVRRALGPIQDYCLECRLPPLTSIVVGKNSGIPGTGFIGWDVNDLQAAHQQVFRFRWADIENPYVLLGIDDTIESMAKTLNISPTNSKQVYAKVKLRGVAQVVFRAALMRAYEEQCAFCGLSFHDALEAAHIVPWSLASDEIRVDPRNGFLLCSTHHKLFDCGTMTVDDSMCIHFKDPSMEWGGYSRSDKAMTVHLHGKTVLLPECKDLWPAPQFLAEHRKLHGWSGLE